MRDEVEQLLLVERTLGLAMLQPQVMERMVRAGVAAAEFEHEAQAAMYRAMVAAFGRNMRADAGTVEAAMRADGWEAKEAKRWVRAAEDAGRGASVDDETLSGYIDTIRTQAALRRLKALGQELVAAADKGEQVSSLAARVTAEVDAIVAGSTSNRTKTAATLAADLARRLDNEAASPVLRAPLGIAPIDEACQGGPRLGSVVVFGADTGVGKTTFTRHMILSMIRAGRRVAMMTFESQAEPIYDGIVEMRAGTRIALRDKTPYGLTRIIEANGFLANCCLHIDDAEAMTVEEVSSKVHGFVKRDRVDVVFIDYVQDIERSTKHARDDLNFAHISKSLRRLTQRHGILLVELAQLNDTVEGGDARKKPTDGPTEKNIAFTKQFAKDASYIVMADRPKLSDDDTLKDVTRLRLVKNRHEGTLARAWMKYDQKTTRLADCDAHGHILEPAKAGAPMQPALEPQAPAHDDFLDSPEDAWDAATKKT